VKILWFLFFLVAEKDTFFFRKMAEKDTDALLLVSFGEVSKDLLDG